MWIIVIVLTATAGFFAISWIHCLDQLELAHRVRDDYREQYERALRDVETLEEQISRAQEALR